MSNEISPNQFINQEQSVFSYHQWQERFIRNVFYASSIIGLPAVIAASMGNTDSAIVAVYIVSYIILLLVTFLRLPYWQKSVVLLALIYGVGFVGLLETGIWGDTRVFFISFITMATLLFSASAGVIAAIISFVSIGVIGPLVLSGRVHLVSSSVGTGTLDSWITAVLGMLVLSAVIISAINAIQNEFDKARKRTNEYLQSLVDQQGNLEERVEDRTHELNRRSSQLEAAAQIARAAAEVHDLNELLDSVVRQISNRFNFYHTGIFLTDTSGQKLNLAAASSEGGQRMLARGHKLEIGRQGIVGFAAYQKRSRIAQDVGADEAFFNNPDLPDTHSEVALPLIVQDRVIGVLDIQSQAQNAFSLDDVYALQTMADQIAMAIENTRLIERSRSAISDLEAISAIGTTKAWKNQLASQVKGYTYTAIGIEPIGKRNGSLSTGNEKVIKITLSLRGREIGEISLQRKQSDPAWTATDRDMLERIATQVVLSLENARLLEESQRNAVREQTVNELSSHFSNSLDVETLLQNAVREIHRLPQVSEVSIFINPAEENQISE